MSQTNSSIAPLILSNNDFLPYTLFIVIDKTTLSILITRVVITIYPFYSLTLKDLSYLRVWAFIIFKAFPPPIQAIPSPLGSYHLQLLISGIYRNYYASNTAYFIFLGKSPSQSNSAQSLAAISLFILLDRPYILLYFSR